jgi:molybdopterin-guanine dinucleotide biosynthesis adapter protein
MRPYLIAIVGHSGAGKTTLIERLLPMLNAREIRVATIKHSHHEIALDAAGKDSWRHRQAGARASMLLTPSGMQLVADTIDCDEPEQLAQRYFSDMDLVLAEGFSRASCNKIEVLRTACSAVARCAMEDGLIAMVTDVGNSNMRLPNFALDDIRGIAQFIADSMGQGRD